MLPPQVFAGFPLDRHSERRTDATWLGALRERGRVCIIGNTGVVLENDRLALVSPALTTDLFLGTRDGIGYFARDLSGSGADDAKSDSAPRAVIADGSGAAALSLGAGQRWEGLRGAAQLLPADEAAIAGTATAIAAWNRSHRYCGTCGATTAMTGGGWRRICDSCKTETFPRTDPVVIMLVVHGERCLLARQARWPSRMMSALAGFVEPGETPEEAVRREVHEEVGLTVEAVRYLGAQPWPFPMSLMLGFIAEARSETLELDTTEIERAEWLDKDEARAVVEGQHARISAPSSFAIAHHLLRAWVYG